MRLLLTLATAAAALAVTPAAAQNLITDGGFDAGTGRGFGPAWTVVLGQSATTDSLLRVQGQDYTDCCGAPGSPEARANYFATFGAGNSSNEVILLQNVMLAQGTYTIRFDAGAFGDVQRFSFGFFNYAAGAYEYEQAVFPTPTTDLDALLQTFSFTTTLAGGTYAVAFSNFFGSPTINTDAVLDNVVLAAVPEPATWALLIGGIGATGGALRRRKTTVAFA